MGGDRQRKEKNFELRKKVVTINQSPSFFLAHGCEGGGDKQANGERAGKETKDCFQTDS